MRNSSKGISSIPKKAQQSPEVRECREQRKAQGWIVDNAARIAGITSNVLQHNGVGISQHNILKNSQKQVKQETIQIFFQQRHQHLDGLDLVIQLHPCIELSLCSPGRHVYCLYMSVKIQCSNHFRTLYLELDF